MAYFPFFTDIAGKTGVIIGGGRVALRKIRKLLPYGPRLRAIAPEFCPEIREIEELELAEREFRPEDLVDADFVIAASSDRQANALAGEICRERRIPVNIADDPAGSSFLFPALVKRGAMTVGITTGGGSPSAAIYLKEKIDQLIPENLDDILDFLQEQRNEIKQQGGLQSERRDLLRQLFFACMEQGRPLSAPEVERLEQERKD